MMGLEAGYGVAVPWRLDYPFVANEKDYTIHIFILYPILKVA
jgi:hypothetical protein